MARTSQASTLPVSSIDRYESTFVVSLDPSKGDFADLNAAIKALPPSGGKIFVKAGVYPIANTLTIVGSNVNIQGEGMGITVFVGSSGMTGNTPVFEAFSKASDGTPRALTVDTARGDTTIQISPSDASSFNAGDYVLLSSNKSVDTEAHGVKHAGEVKQITAVDAATGVLTTDDQIFDEYTIADAAQVVRITMLRNITLSDCSFTTEAPSSTLKVGFTHFRFIENLQIDRVEVHDGYFAGFQLQSVRNSSISNCYIHHIKDIEPVNPPNPANERYGILVGNASQNVTISGCRFSQMRHAVTTGGSSGANQSGVQRNIVVANCTSMLSDTAHYDTHQPAENVTFIGCVADGGIAAGASGPIGFQMRGSNCSVTGCSVLQAVGRGIMIFGPASSGTVINGNVITNVKALLSGKEGDGIFFDSGGNSNHSVTGNVIQNCEGSAISNAGSSHDIVISGNIIRNVNTAVPGAAIQITDAARSVISSNNIAAASSNPAIAVVDADDSVVVSNPGYNPVGVIAKPWPANGGNVTNVTVGNISPASGAVYRVCHTQKTIVITGGDVSKIVVDGADTGARAGAFKLGVGETIAVTYGNAAPDTLIFAE
jgi:hypothetical protein